MALVSAILLSAGLGSIHAFSVFLEPLELRFDVSRDAVSLAYSFALASLTLAVLLGHRIYHRFSPSILAMLTMLLAAAGLALAAGAPHIAAFWLGYGVIFGFANGLGYGFALHITNQAVDRHRGLAMGSVTAVYAVGASLAAKLFESWIAVAGVGGALFRLLIVLLILGLLASLCLRPFRSDIEIGDEQGRARLPLDRQRLLLCWLTYGAGVAAGLMAMGHAAGIVAALGGSVADGTRGAIAITLANALGGFGAGYIADRQPIGRLLIALGLLSALALVLLALTETIALAIWALALIGLTYGAMISIFPFATTLIFGRERYALAYGRIFTSWGLAGMAGPWLAGILYSRTGSYAPALLLAASLACVAAVMSFYMSRSSESTELGEPAGRL